ncbi:MAG: hypothetical protein ABIP39_11490 [Polyangiaceae bacterium]
MIIPLIAGTIALGCIAASTKRLSFAIAPTFLDTPMLVQALRTGLPPKALRQAIADSPEADWERAVMEALDQPEAARNALLNEQLSEMDYRLQRWTRVPRVCASIASTSGFLLATVALTEGLNDGVALDSGTLVHDAISSVTLGIAGAVYCVAAQFRARTEVKDRLAATDKLIERLERSVAAADADIAIRQPS